MCYLQPKQVTGSSEAQRTNLLKLPRTSKMHSRRKGGSGSLLRSLKCIWQGLEEGLLVKLLRTCVRCKMYMWIQHFLFARTAGVKLDGILSKKSLPFVKEYLRAVFCPPHCSWSTSMISSPLYQRGSQTHCMQTTWQSGMRLNTPPLQPAGSKKPSGVSAVDTGLGPRDKY